MFDVGNCHRRKTAKDYLYFKSIGHIPPANIKCYKMEWVKEFIKLHLIRDKCYPAQQLYNRYLEWASENGCRISTKDFGKILTRLGHIRKHTSVGNQWTIVESKTYA